MQLLQSPVKPAARGGQAAVSIQKRIVLFGGADRVPTPFSDIWVLQAGGGSGDQSAGVQHEWFKVNPASTTGDRLLPRVGCSMCAIGDIIYIYGGQDPVTLKIFDDIIALDINSWNWAQVDVPGVKPPSRHSHSAGVLNGRSLIIFGGAGSAGMLGDLWIFDTFTRIWSHPKTLGTPASPREMHTGTMISETEMLVFGGRSATSQVLSDVALFDGASLQWRRVEGGEFPRCSHAAVCITSHCIKISPTDVMVKSEFGGAPNPASPLVLVFGGFNGIAVESSLLCIDPDKARNERNAESLRVWEIERADASDSSSMGEKPQTIRPEARFGHSMAVTNNDDGSLDVVVMAGVNSSKDLNDVAIWRPLGNVQPQLSPAETSSHLDISVSVGIA